MAKSYRSQYLDPRWQKKRLEALNEAGFSCSVCKKTDQTLHVHHKQYITDRDVWDYETTQLSVLCEPCHNEVHSRPDLLNIVVSFIPGHPDRRREAAFILAGYYGIDLRMDFNPLQELHYEAGRSVGKQLRTAITFADRYVEEALK
jgi:hypothetical protein